MMKMYQIQNPKQRPNYQLYEAPTNPAIHTTERNEEALYISLVIEEEEYPLSITCYTTHPGLTDCTYGE